MRITQSRIVFRLLAIVIVLLGNQQLCSQEITSEHKIKPLPSRAKIPTRIAFGSCGNQSKPQPILKKVVEREPDLFIYLGDNIYGDTKDMNVLAKEYSQLGDKPEFQTLARSVSLLSVWDDHDYGWNDAGKEYEFKEPSKKLFMDFWQVPGKSNRRTRPGIYGSHVFSESGHTLQIILLDTRTFRDKLKRNKKPLPDNSQFKNDYEPDSSADKTLLGNAQWKWLEQELAKPADLRIVCSSIQFGHQYNGWESWTNLPLEQKRMVDLIKKTKANGVIFISGDVHWGELSRRDFDDCYPIYDMTASGLTEEWYNVEPNLYRIGQAVRENHFGMIQIDWKTKSPTVVFQTIDSNGTVRLANSIKLDQLVFPAKAKNK